MAEESTQPAQRGTNVQGRATRKAVLDAAGKLFAEKGYAGANLRQIAKVSGAGLSSIMYHFGSKKNLYLETIRHYIVDTARLEEHFEVFRTIDYDDRQAVADALRDAIRSFLGECHGPQRTEYVTGLYKRVIVEGDDQARGMLLQCFAGVQELLPEVVARIRPDASDADVAFWVQLLWSQLQYTVMGKELILYDMGLGEDYPLEYLDEAAWRFARYCCLPLGLPDPTRPG